MNTQTLLKASKKIAASVLAALLGLYPTAASANVVNIRLQTAGKASAPVSLAGPGASALFPAANAAAIGLGASALPRPGSLEVSGSAAAGIEAALPRVQAAGELRAAPSALPAAAPSALKRSGDGARGERQRAAPSVRVGEKLSGIRREVSALRELKPSAASGDAYGAGRALENALTGQAGRTYGGLVAAPSALKRSGDGARGERPRAAPADDAFEASLRPGARLNPAPGRASAQDEALQQEVEGVSGTISALKEEIRRVIVGQEDMVDSIIVAMIAGEHILLEGVPGVAKTRTVQAFAEATGADFNRIQGTPDKMPADILGAEVLQTLPDGTRKLVHERGPIFARVVLFDEINRAMPKTQSALLEAMQERQVTIGNETFDLPRPFLLLATQNPIEQEGTYPLPEAQQDRFMYKIIISQPSRDERKKINALNRTKEKVKTNKVVEIDDLLKATSIAERIRMDPSLEDYVQDILDAVLAPHKLGIGEEGLVEQAMITRASIHMEKAARIHALMQGRSRVIAQDVRDVAPKIMRHRVMLSYAAGERTSDDLIREILEKLPTPVPDASPRDGK